MIKKFWSNELQDYSISNGTKKYLNFKKINIFIGKNNSGKSLLLRILFGFAEDDVSLELEEDNLKDLISDINKLKNCMAESITLQNSITVYKANLATIAEVGIISSDGRKQVNLINTNRVLISNGAFQSNDPHVVPTIRNLFKGEDINFFNRKIKEKIELNKYYIPILKGMRPLNDLEGVEQNQAPYIKRTIEDYFKDKSRLHNNIYTGENLFRILNEKLLGMPTDRDLIYKYESLLSLYFFEGKQVNLIPKYKSDVVEIFIEGEKQRPIYNLGDGLQQILIITSIAFLTSIKSLILVEEPETHLHPGYLRKLIEFLSNETEHQYFFTTHSNHLLEFGREDDYNCLIYKVIKNEKKFQISEVDEDRALLTELGVRCSSVYLANCSIWVEGITDRKYLREYMKMYLLHLKKHDEAAFNKYSRFIEDFHYVFVEYQGTGLAHWCFEESYESDDEAINAIKVTSEILVVADGDIATKGSRKQKLESELGDRFIALDGKEIENLIPIDILKKAARRFADGSRPKMELDQKKHEAFNDTSYYASQTGVGNILDPLLVDSSAKKFSEQSGTVRDKDRFCRDVLIELKENQNLELTNPIKNLCKRIFKHIETCNQ